MANPDACIEGSDGWVLYTTEEGHQYHWNHLTRESRWATDETIQDTCAEEAFEEHIRQRLSVADAGDYHATRLGSIEAGDEVEKQAHDDCAPARSIFAGGATLVTPYSGTGSTTRCTSQFNGHNESDKDNPSGEGFSVRLANTLRKTMSTMECSHQAPDKHDRFSDWDPELGYTLHRTAGCKISPTPKRRHDACRGSASIAANRDSDNHASSSRSSSSNSRSRDETGSSSNSSGYERLERRRKIRRGTSWKRRGNDRTRRSANNSRHQATERNVQRSAEGQSSPERARRPRNRHSQSWRPRKGARHRFDHVQLPMYVNSDKKNANAVSMVMGGVTGIGRQALVQVVKVAVRAVVGGWTGMTSAALMFAKHWQMNNAPDDGGQQSGAEKRVKDGSGSDAQMGNYRDYDPRMGRNPLPLSLPENVEFSNADYSRPVLSQSRTGGRLDNRTPLFGRGEVDGKNSLAEGFHEEEQGEAGVWVGSDGGVEERKGRVTSPPRAPASESSTTGCIS